jgi:hypothetical protein
MRRAIFRARMWVVQMPTVTARLLVALVAGLILVGSFDVLGAEPYAPDPQAPAAQRPVIQAEAGLPSYDRPVRFYCMQGFRCINHLRSFCVNRYAGPGRPRRCVCEPSHPLRAC